MKQSVLITECSRLTDICNETTGEEIGDYNLVFYDAFVQFAQSAEHYKTLYGTQTGRDNLLFMNMIDLLFLFLLSLVRSRRIFFLRCFQYFVFMAELVSCK